MSVKGKIKPLRDYVLITDMNFDEVKTSSGIIIRSDNGESHGVKPRWGRVYAIGPEQKDLSIDQWVLVEHGRWTRGIEVEDESGKTFEIRRIDTDCVLLVSDEKPTEEYWSAE